jgi:hypothetical protein
VRLAVVGFAVAGDIDRGVRSGDAVVYRAAGVVVVAGRIGERPDIARVAAGEIRPKTLVRKEADGTWVAASLVEGLFAGSANSRPAIEIQSAPDKIPTVKPIPIATA